MADRNDILFVRQAFQQIFCQMFSLMELFSGITSGIALPVSFESGDNELDSAMPRIDCIIFWVILGLRGFLINSIPIPTAFSGFL